jgi:hypothetical protein
VEAEVLQRDLSTFMPQELRYSLYLLYLVQKYKVKQVTPAELRNLVWAFATPQTAALLRLYYCFTAALLVLTPADLSNLVWAFATAGCKSEVLFKAVEREV